MAAHKGRNHYSKSTYKVRLQNGNTLRDQDLNLWLGETKTKTEVFGYNDNCYVGGQGEKFASLRKLETFWLKDSKVRESTTKSWSSYSSSFRSNKSWWVPVTETDQHGSALLGKQIPGWTLVLQPPGASSWLAGSPSLDGEVHDESELWRCLLEVCSSSVV